MYNLLMVKLY